MALYHFWSLQCLAIAWLLSYSPQPWYVFDINNDMIFSAYSVNLFYKAYRRITNKRDLKSRDSTVSLRWYVFRCGLSSDMLFIIDHLRGKSIFCQKTHQCWLSKETYHSVLQCWTFKPHQKTEKSHGPVSQSNNRLDKLLYYYFCPHQQMNLNMFDKQAIQMLCSIWHYSLCTDIHVFDISKTSNWPLTLQ